MITNNQGCLSSPQRCFKVGTLHLDKKEVVEVDHADVLHGFPQDFKIILGRPSVKSIARTIKEVGRLKDDPWCVASMVCSIHGV